MIRIKSKKNNFRRCGVAHPGEWTEYADDRFSEGEMVILTAEPMLVVEIVPEDKEVNLTKMTVKELTEAISQFKPAEELKGLRKEELIRILTEYLKSTDGAE